MDFSPQPLGGRYHSLIYRLMSLQYRGHVSCHTRSTDRMGGHFRSLIPSPPPVPVYRVRDRITGLLGVCPKSTGQQVREQYPHFESNEMETIPGDVPRGPCQTAQLGQAWRFQRGWDRARNQAESGASPEVGGIGTSPAKGSPGSLGGSVSKGLTPPGGARGHRRKAKCCIMGWEGRSALCMGTEQCCPAKPGPHQTAKHNGSLRQADNSALSGQRPLGWHPLRLCFSLAPVRESLGSNDPGNNEWEAGLSSLSKQKAGPIAADEEPCSGYSRVTEPHNKGSQSYR